MLATAATYAILLLMLNSLLIGCGSVGIQRGEMLADPHGFPSGGDWTHQYEGNHTAYRWSIRVPFEWGRDFLRGTPPSGGE